MTKVNENVLQENTSWVTPACWDKFRNFPDVDLSFNPNTDISAVSQSDALDIKDAFSNGFIPDNVVIGDTDFDNADDPKAIIGRPANEFEAIHMVQSIKEVKAKAETPAN